MKITKLFFFSLLIIVAASCGTKSKKGAWTADDKDKFNKEMEKAKSTLAPNLGDNMQKFIDCYYDKVQANYENFDEANKDEDGAKKYAKDCILSSIILSTPSTDTDAPKSDTDAPKEEQ